MGLLGEGQTVRGRGRGAWRNISTGVLPRTLHSKKVDRGSLGRGGGEKRREFTEGLGQ